MKLDDQLKAAIVKMPVKEKDKLLLRLVAKDRKLVRRLVFELIEGGSTIDERVSRLKKDIHDDLFKLAVDHATPGLLLVFYRHWNARITEHVHATKDKLGEVSLVFYMLAEGLRIHHKMLSSFPERRSDTLAPYLVQRTKAVMAKAEKLHEDYFIEFRQDLQELLQYIWAFPPTAAIAEDLQLPRNWSH